MESIREKVCRRIQDLRKQAGLTQEQLAEKSELSVDGIRKIETLRTTPTLETLEKIGKALQLSLSELLHFDAPEHISEHKQELDKIHLYLATRDLAEIRLARRVLEAVMGELKDLKETP